MVEYTLTMYLFGLALGTLFWGKISDTFGRKPCIIAGMLVFMMGCLGCYGAHSIEALIISRLIQAFGGSVGSVLTQAVCRDTFQGPSLGKAYSTTGSALSLFPALGPLCGGLIAEVFGWRNIFIFLIAFALIVTCCVALILPETHPRAVRKQTTIKDIIIQLITDRKVLGFGLIVAGGNGILFSYFAEGSFYLINGLGLSPSDYGLSFIPIGASAMWGGILSKKLQNKMTSQEVMGYGLVITTSATALFSLISVIHHYTWTFSATTMIAVTVLSQMGSIFGQCMATSNALALALVDYKHATGTASSIFGFFYYCMISLFTFFMGLLHNGTLLPMPLYFLALSCFTMGVNRVCLKK